jgi:uncharacterized repeat protein (TIGR03803 family)
MGFKSLRIVAGVLGSCLAVSSSQGAVVFSPLVAFAGTNGASPKAGLVQANDGNFYGATANGGANKSGTVFRLSADGSTLTTLYSFTGGNDGANPLATLLQGADGNLYGTASSGGASNAGTVFQITTSGGFTLLASLSGTNGAHPDAALVQAADGSLYGTTDSGGPYDVVTYQATGYGSIFRVATNGDLTTPVLFAGTNGTHPNALTAGDDGSFYGTTLWGGPYIKGSALGVGYGTIFKLSADGTLTNLYSFTGKADGGWPYAGLVRGADGNFYGVTFDGGYGLGYGVVFRITPEGDYTWLYQFHGSEGANPYGGLVQGTDGNFYGTTYGGGANNYGGVFQVTPGGTLTGLHPFAIGAGGNTPLNAMIQGGDGNFYGTTYSGGAGADGTVFRLSVPLPPVIQSVKAGNGGIALTWSAVATQSYQAQYKAGQAQTTWSNLGNQMTATNATLTLSDTDPADPQRWYRVVLLP